MNKIPKLHWYMLIVGIILYVLGCWIYRKLNPDIAPKIESTKKQIDSITVKRDSLVFDITKRSNSGSKTSTKIIKSLKDEKIIIRDTTYNAMCKYVENYRPE